MTQARTTHRIPGRLRRLARALPLGLRIGLSYNVRNVRQRWRVTVLALAGIALVVAVFVALVALSSGLRIALASTGVPENAIFVQRGSQGELTSGIARDHAAFLSTDDRIARDAQGRVLASPELVVAATLPRRADGMLTNVQLRGVGPRAFDVRAGVRIVEGRRLTPGLPEVIVGRRLVGRFENVGLGSVLRIKQRDWQVVGVFAAEGGSFESEVWGDLDVMASAFNRVGGYQSLTVRMHNPAAIAGWDEEVRRDPRLQVQLKPERQYYEDQAGPVGAALLVLALFVSFVMGIGAVFGAMNTMYALVVQRTREIATLRALGFPRTSILISFVIESIVIALVAGAIGCLIALPVNGITTATGNITFSELAFAFRITPQSLAAGLVFGLVMGFVGGLLPALRAARLPIQRALREA
jgi:putative ABC transport system permease protein